MPNYLDKLMQDYEREQAQAALTGGVPRTDGGFEIAPGLFVSPETARGETAAPTAPFPNVPRAPLTDMLGLTPPPDDRRLLITNQDDWQLPKPLQARARREHRIRRDEALAGEKARIKAQREAAAQRLRDAGAPESAVQEWLKRTARQAQPKMKEQSAGFDAPTRTATLTEQAEKRDESNVRAKVREHLLNKLGKAAGHEAAPARKEPWQVSAEEEALRRRKESTRTIAGIAENLKKAGRGMTMAGAGAAAPELPTDVTAEDLRYQEAELEDKLRPAERQYLENMLGIPIGDDMSLSRMRALVPSMAGAIGTLRGANVKEQQLGLATERHHALQDYRTLIQGRIPEPQLKDLTSIRSTLERLHIVEDRYNQAAQDLGPVWSRVNKLARKFGFNSKVAADAQAGLLGTFLRYMYGTGGKQLSDKEIEIWQETLMKATDNDMTFRQLLQTFREGLMAEHSTMLTSQLANRRDVEPHLLPGQDVGRTEDGRFTVQHYGPPPKMTGRGDESGGVLMESPSGEQVQVRADKVQHYLDKGARIVQ